jgi:CheY-like chemotaxis protein
MASKRVLSVGQCYADHGSITRTLQQHFGAEVVPADSEAEALDLLRQQPFDLVLVNRILDCDGSSGIAIIRRLMADADHRRLPLMLVSNYEDAQREAEAAGAEPGFGKAALDRPAMLARVQPWLGNSA